MPEIMKSYLNCTHDELTSTSRLYKIMVKKSDYTLKDECWNISTDTVKKFQNLIGDQVDELTCTLLLRPMVRARALASIISAVNIQTRKKVNKRLIKYATAIKKDLIKAAHKPDTIRLFIDQTELDYEKLSNILDEYITHQNFLCGLNFRNGKTLNPSNIKRYGIFCLFNIGEKLELSKEGKPSPLYQFIEIATGENYKKIGEIYASYKKADITYESQNNTALRFIYNPDDYPTISTQL